MNSDSVRRNYKLNIERVYKQDLIKFIVQSCLQLLHKHAIIKEANEHVAPIFN